MTNAGQRNSGKYWLSQLVQIVVIVTLISVALDWYRTKDIKLQQAPELKALRSDGQYVDVTEKSHEAPVVVYFWATWCPPCKFVSPSVSWLSDYYQVIGVSGSSGSDERVKQIMHSKGYQFNNINDPSGQIMQAWEIGVTPTIYILKDGEIESVTTGVSTPIGILLRIWLAR